MRLRNEHSLVEITIDNKIAI